MITNHHFPTVFPTACSTLAAARSAAPGEGANETAARSREGRSWMGFPWLFLGKIMGKWWENGGKMMVFRKVSCR